MKSMYAASEIKHFHYIEPVTWPTVLAVWSEAEANNPLWIEHYQSRGYTSWKEWRAATHAPLKGETLEWHLYQLIDPLGSIPAFRGGPFVGWKNVYYSGVHAPYFKDIVQHPELAKNGKIISLLETFPAETTVIGVKAGDDIYIIDGMHRCCALAMAAQQNKTIKTDMKIMLAQFPDDVVPELGTPVK